jgi:hypothetical protein
MIKAETFCQPCNATVYSRIYDGGMEEAVTHIENGRIPIKETGCGISGEHAGTKSIEEALQLARYGWYAGSAAIQDLIDENIGHIIPGQRQAIGYEDTYDVIGDEFDLGRYITGQSDYMERYDDMPLPIPGRYLNILIEPFINMYTRSRELLRHGTTVAAAIIALEAQGIQVGAGLMSRFYGKPSGRRDTLLEYYIPLKNPGEPLDIPKLAFTVTHPSMSRRIEPALMDQEDTALRQLFYIGREFPLIYKGEECGYGLAREKPIPQDHIPEYMRITREGIILGGELYDGSQASVNVILDTVNKQYEAMQARDRVRAQTTHGN